MRLLICIATALLVCGASSAVAQPRPTMGSVLGAPNMGGAQQGTYGPQGAYGRFSGAADRWRLKSRPQAPATRFELRAGAVIPATLISGINSDLPGQIIAQVSADVYDTATGKHLLIPQGSRLIGRYSSEIIYGQGRLLVAWQRIVYPDGTALDIGAMPGADAAGYSGFHDQVDNHYFRTFASAILMSAIVGGISMSQSTGNDDGQTSASEAMTQALGRVLGRTAAQIISKNLNVAPTLKIRPGYRFNVMVTKDIVLRKPYRPFDYNFSR